MYSTISFLGVNKILLLFTMRMLDLFMFVFHVLASVLSISSKISILLNAAFARWTRRR